MKIIRTYLLLFVISCFCFLPTISAEEKNKVTLYLFYGDGCPHCSTEKIYLEELKDKYSNLEIIEYEVWYNSSNSTLLEQVKSYLGKNNNYVPFTVIGTNSYTGYNDSFKNSIEDSINYCMENSCEDVIQSVLNGEEPSEEVKDENENQSRIINLPFFGEVNLKSASLPIVAIILGLIDGFNPCAMWILLFLISMLIGMKDRKRMLILGIVFLTTSAFIYALFMGAWLQVMIRMTEVNLIKKAIGIIAILGASWNLYGFYKSIKKKDVGCEVVNNSKRKKMIAKIKKITTEKSLWIALIGIIILAISVNFVELACSAGWPLVFTEILALNDLNSLSYILYITLYILFYLFDDIIIFIIAMVTFKITGISNKYSKYSHLIGGILMLIIGLLMILKPEWLMLNF